MKLFSFLTVANCFCVYVKYLYTYILLTSVFYGANFVLLYMQVPGTIYELWIIWISDELRIVNLRSDM